MIDDTTHYGKTPPTSPGASSSSSSEDLFELESPASSRTSCSQPSSAKDDIQDEAEALQRDEDSEEILGLSPSTLASLDLEAPFDRQKSRENTGKWASDQDFIDLTPPTPPPSSFKPKRQNPGLTMDLSDIKPREWIPTPGAPRLGVLSTPSPTASSYGSSSTPRPPLVSRFSDESCLPTPTEDGADEPAFEPAPFPRTATQGPSMSRQGSRSGGLTVDTGLLSPGRAAEHPGITAAQAASSPGAASPRTMDAWTCFGISSYPSGASPLMRRSASSRSQTSPSLYNKKPLPSSPLAMPPSIANYDAEAPRPAATSSSWRQAPPANNDDEEEEEEVVMDMNEAKRLYHTLLPGQPHFALSPSPAEPSPLHESCSTEADSGHSDEQHCNPYFMAASR